MSYKTLPIFTLTIECLGLGSRTRPDATPDFQATCWPLLHQNSLQYAILPTHNSNAPAETPLAIIVIPGLAIEPEYRVFCPIDAIVVWITFTPNAHIIMVVWPQFTIVTPVQIRFFPSIK